MFDKGDLISYSVHGVCRIDEVCVKSLAGVSKTYYELHPLSNETLKISIPVDRAPLQLQKLMGPEEAMALIDSFMAPGIPWIDNNHERHHNYSAIVKTGDREGIAKVANTLMRRKQWSEQNHKKLGNQDNQLLLGIQNTSFNEMAIVLKTTYDDVLQAVQEKVAVNQS
ncbi:CarD family transcriptional regulator [Paenibacillus phoenicis]|uniref:CarD family transcriptional regulator n=1 Tax=Paenibacillus phoenicis TaxID=554117 RepID=A0ABU5PFL7_9BACL|nr:MULTISPECIES: CarD family transcriptional regulator [Paenibacillus]EES72066.1 CarD-like protein [Paenibacillus sp. oral taxon 786 str. D14]MCT2193730.1 CarD family transcriptional regulator [Paenibacillus sp. p3-SID1389]MEA3568725.1 CarD family transcriptional regulator [Paenibacillus phoenicis]